MPRRNWRAGCARRAAEAWRALPSIEEYPIPRDVAPGAGWSARLREIAAHVGAYEALMIAERHGGEEFYIPTDATRNPFLDLIGTDKARALSWAFGRERIAIPTARPEIARARRAGLIAAVRARQVTVSDAARIMHVRRDYASKLVNGTNEGIATVPIAAPGACRDARQLDMFGGADGRCLPWRAQRRAASGGAKVAG